MSAAFDQLAPSYDSLWTNSRRGRAQRDAVWREIDPLFRAGDRILDLGCGTGEDALHLEARGVRVHATDASAGMVEMARLRGVDAECLAIEDLARLAGPYDGALSNFGALNCVADLDAAGAALARILRPGAWLAISVMPRLCWGELLRFNFRRLRREVAWRDLDIRYPSHAAVLWAFSDFAFIRRRSLSLGDHCLYIFRRT